MNFKSIYIFFITSLLFLKVGLGYAQPSLKSIVINGKEKKFQAKENLNLPASEDDIIIEFASVSVDSVIYQFKLQGFDNQWIKSKFPAIRYTNLAGGTYLFQWKTTIQQKDSPIATTTFVVERSLTEEWWFIPSAISYVVLLISAAIYFFLLYNLRQKVKLQAIRNRIAADLHDEVGSTLNSIAIFSRLAEIATKYYLY
jgi:signal transduction histidine kinase